MYIFKKKRKSKLHLANELNIFVKYTNIPKQYLVYLIKGSKIRIYDLNIIVFDESIIKLIIAGLNSDFDIYDLFLIKENNGLSKIIDNVDL